MSDDSTTEAEMRSLLTAIEKACREGADQELEWANRIGSVLRGFGWKPHQADSTTGAEGLAKRMWVDPTSKEPEFYGEYNYTGYFDYIASDSPNPGPGAVEYIKADSLRCKHGIRWPHECSDCFHETFPDRAEQSATIAALRQTVERLQRPHTDVAYRQRMITQLRAVGQAEAADMIASLDARNCDIDDDRAVLRSQVEALRPFDARLRAAERAFETLHDDESDNQRPSAVVLPTLVLIRDLRATLHSTQSEDDPQ